MKPIKFRGRAIETGRDVKIGEYVFGDLRIVGIRPHIYKEAHCYYEEELIEVDPDSVAQLVGYDANGKEVYEGDTVLRYDSEEEFIEAPENGVLREVILYTQVNPDLEDYYCLVKEADQ